MEDHRIDDVVIVGGGTAGWMTAAYLGKAFGDGVQITVVEAPSIPRIGVGEATVPNLQPVLFDFLGVPEDEWMRSCNASFKMAVKFVNWRTAGPGSTIPRSDDHGSDHFFHPFGTLPEHSRLPLSHYWFAKRERGDDARPFSYACFREPPLMDANLAPRFPDGTPATRYAWHFDAQLLADFLMRFSIDRQGARHVTAEVDHVALDDRGYVASLHTSDGRRIDGDLFVDCSGFRGLLINQTLNEPFLDMSDRLLCDRAVAAAIPHDDEEIEPYTSAIAMPSGWTWKVPLLDRFGSGYVYSSAFQTDDGAVEEFCQLWNLAPDEVSVRRLGFRVGRNRRAWVKNCVSIGLSSCFLEPLEASGIYFVTAAVYQLAKHFPDRRFDPARIERFNREIEMMFDDSRDFIQAHYSYSPRNDTEFWRATKELALADDFLEKVEMYRTGLPVNQPVSDENTYYSNFEAEFRNFWTNGSYWSILAGLGVLPDASPAAITYRPDALEGADVLFNDVQQRQEELLALLPRNRDFLQRLHGEEARLTAV